MGIFSNWLLVTEDHHLTHCWQNGRLFFLPPPPPLLGQSSSMNHQHMTKLRHEICLFIHLARYSQRGILLQDNYLLFCELYLQPKKPDIIDYQIILSRKQMKGGDEDAGCVRAAKHPATSQQISTPGEQQMWL